MGQKEIQKRHNSIWSFFKFWRFGNNSFGRSSGFTLVELLTVVGIIGILIIGVLTVLDPFAQFQKANDAKRKADFSQIQKALETYFQDNNVYPPSSSEFKIIRLDLTPANWGSQFTPYMTLLPKDPKPQRNYVYYSTGQSYYLYASLERSNDPKLCNSGNPCSNLPVGASCGTNATCNFGVSSSNVNP